MITTKNNQASTSQTNFLVPSTTRPKTEPPREPKNAHSCTQVQEKLEQNNKNLFVHQKALQGNQHKLAQNLSALMQKHHALFHEHERLKEQHIALSRQHDALREKHDVLAHSFNNLSEMNNTLFASHTDLPSKVAVVEHKLSAQVEHTHQSQKIAQASGPLVQGALSVKRFAGPGFCEREISR